MKQLQAHPAPPDSRIPILIVGDAPSRPTGLARIARDIAEQLRRDGAAGRLPIRVAQLGLYYDGRRCNWHVYPIKDEANWGQGDVGSAWDDWSGSYAGPGVMLSVWDPGRCPAITAGFTRYPMGHPEEAWFGRLSAAGKAWPQFWGYFAVDAFNGFGKLGGPVPETLDMYARVLAYASFGSEVLEATTGKPVEWLPHGLDTDTFSPAEAGTLPETWPERWDPSGEPVVGVVATNTPRKDLGMVFAALAGVRCRLWLHTDQLISNAWSIPELAELYGRNHPDRLHVSLALEDEEIARWYSACAATLAPGLGEGFGYPIVESLACGTPVVHIRYAAGPQFAPAAAWRIPVDGQRLEGPYALVRPVVSPNKVVEALQAAVSWKRKEPELVAAYCRGSVQHLDWRNLWPYWREWFRRGLETLPAAAAAAEEGDAI